jgi:L-alanine-DL-glutamate epimerase-like enolase superfamily enzyme
MAKIAAIESGFCRIPLPVLLTDSTHGQMRAFELNTVRVRDAEGAEGIGYTFTAGRNGGAVDATIKREFGEIFSGEAADDIERLRQRPGGRFTTAGAAGFAIAPDRAGHGVDFDWKGLEALAA